MTWSNLLSGLGGAIFGGLIAIVASVTTARQQRALTLESFAEERRQARLRSSYSSCVEILRNLLLAKEAMFDVMNGSHSEKLAAFDRYHRAAESISILYNPLIADATLRSRIGELQNLLQEWYYTTKVTTGQSVQEERLDAIMPFMEYINLSIQAHLDGQPFPETISLPDLPAA